ncbi:hypothetical protein CpipJ_CPIJ011376 [Culex quinquefasciatus]|uniref:Uncharacterized protein n=1 Tax=Culex quinquefasciatus TaxID=7176 RepID=B0WW42_CULQU|nr:hypothetical protein CpipJ_CPIJ011376 [Culex quinquefasciatus]|eukprot:XP_001861614.1 hypothetical protein CpipJ_CPIJ011376 [Culex quinquefasciatus]
MREVPQLESTSPALKNDCINRIQTFPTTASCCTEPTQFVVKNGCVSVPFLATNLIEITVVGIFTKLDAFTIEDSPGRSNGALNCSPAVPGLRGFPQSVPG